MLTWLKKDIEAAARTGARWRIAFFARTAGRRGQDAPEREQLLPALAEAGVDLVLTGNTAGWQRSKPGPAPLFVALNSGAGPQAAALVIDAGDGALSGVLLDQAGLECDRFALPPR